MSGAVRSARLAAVAPTLARPVPAPKLSSGELLERARKRIEWAALSLKAAAADVQLAGESGMALREQAEAVEALVQGIAERQASGPTRRERV